MMNSFTSIPARAAALAALVFLAACGDDPVAPPGIEPQIVNNTDAFSYQITSLADASGTFDYTWQNTGTLARVTHSSDAGATGTATVTLRDAAGTVVYTGAFASSGESESSPAGVAGAWTITVIYTNYTNTQVNFAVAMR